jgi:hypothetical protein
MALKICVTEHLGAGGKMFERVNGKKELCADVSTEFFFSYQVFRT